MAIKDKMLWWFIKNIIMSRNEIIDKPGFIILKITERTKTVNVREIVLPENLFSELEKSVVKKYGAKGRQALYSAGKKFGYRFALISKYPKAANEKDFSQFSYFLVRYLESIYARRIEHKIDFAEHKFVFNANNWIVCNKNGIGLLLFDGTGAGMIAYAFDDPSIEGVQSKCEGRGDDHCELVCAPDKYLRNNDLKFHSERSLSGLEVSADRYNSINMARTTRYSSNSFRKLIDGGFIKYSEGTMSINGERFLIIESSLMYILENELKTIDKDDGVLWDASMEWGRSFSARFGKQSPCKFINDLFPGLGFGDFFAVTENGKYKVSVGFFPWTKWAGDCEFVMFRGMISGIISGLAGKKIELKKIRKTVSSSGFSMVLEE
jgi:hypothetical protein